MGSAFNKAPPARTFTPVHSAHASNSVPFHDREARSISPSLAILAAIRVIDNALGAPPIFPDTLIGPLTDAADGIAVIQG